MTHLEREAAIVTLLPLVKTIARSAYRQIGAVEFDDLMGDGYLGLISAVDSYRPERGMALERYARRKVLYAMLDGARRTDRLSQCARRVVQSAENDRYVFAVRNGRMPSSSEIEHRHPKLRSARLSARLRRPVSLDAAATPDTLVPADWEADPAALYCARETEGNVRDAIGRLSSRHRDVLGLYYGGGMRLAAVAQRFAVTPQRVAQLRDSALASVRRAVIAS